MMGSNSPPEAIQWVSAGDGTGKPDDAGADYRADLRLLQRTASFVGYLLRQYRSGDWRNCWPFIPAAFCSCFMINKQINAGPVKAFTSTQAYCCWWCR